MLLSPVLYQTQLVTVSFVLFYALSMHKSKSTHIKETGFKYRNVTNGKAPAQMKMLQTDFLILAVFWDTG